MSSYLGLKLGYINNKVELKTLYFKFVWRVLEEMKNYYSLRVSRTVSQLIMRVRKPKVEYKLPLQLHPREHLDVFLYKQFEITEGSIKTRD